MALRKTTAQDVLRVLEIIGDAQAYLASQGIDQWQDGYPNKERILLDVQNDESYVWEDESLILGTTMFTLAGEPTYMSIDGAWMTDDSAEYGAIHRLAVSANFRNKGLARQIILACEEKLNDIKFDSLRIDTHRQNKGMQHLLTKLGYRYCGVIQLASGDDRLAYEKLM